MEINSIDLFFAFYYIFIFKDKFFYKVINRGMIILQNLISRDRLCAIVDIFME